MMRCIRRFARRFTDVAEERMQLAEDGEADSVVSAEKRRVNIDRKTHAWLRQTSSTQLQRSANAALFYYLLRRRRLLKWCGEASHVPLFSLFSLFCPFSYHFPTRALTQ